MAPSIMQRLLKEDIRSERESCYAMPYEMRKKGTASFWHTEGFYPPSAPKHSEQEWQKMEEELSGARTILTLSEEEDDVFVPYSESTLSHAVNFVRRLMTRAHSAGLSGDSGIGVPRICPADKGSIDVFWEKQNGTLLVNFPADSKIAEFYGRKRDNEISGRFDCEIARPDLVMWLASEK
jgi:hypothetical protein